MATIIRSAKGLQALVLVSDLGDGDELGELAAAAIRALDGRTLRMLSVPTIASAGSLDYEYLRQLMLVARPAERRFTVVGGSDGDTVDAAEFLSNMLNAGQAITLDGRIDSSVIGELSDELLADITYVRAGIYGDGDLRSLPLARCKNLRRLDMAGLAFHHDDDSTLPDSLEILQLAHPLDETEGLASVERLGRMLADDKVCPGLLALELVFDEYEVYNAAYDERYDWSADKLTPEHEAALAEVRRQCARRGIDLDIALPA